MEDTSANQSPEQPRQTYQHLNDEWVENEHLKNVIVSLSSKIVTTTDLEKQITTYSSTLKENDAARAGLRDNLGEASQSAEQRANETHSREVDLNNQVNELKQTENTLNSTIRERDSTIHDREFIISQKDKEIDTLNLKLEDLKEMKSINEKYVDAINDAEKQRVDLQNKFNTCLDDHSAQLKQEHAERQKLIDEKNALNNRLQDSLAEIEDLKKLLTDCRFNCQKKDEKIHELENRLLVLDEIRTQRDKLLIDLKTYQESRDKLHAEIQALKLDFENIRKQDQEHFEQMIKERTDLQEVLKTREIRITELETTILEINSIVNKQRQSLDSIAAECNRLKDVESQLITTNDVNQEYTHDRGVLRQELEKASDFMVDLEEKVHKANSTSLTLLNKVKESEREIDILKDYIYELKSRVAIYIPVREDPIDKKLAEYINNYPDRSKFKIMFMRETSGVYLFGSRRIYVRVEKGKINIRVGGGYLTIDEFLDQYTPVELERIERKTMNTKMAVQRTLVGRELREESPVRSSPVRAKRRSPKKSPKKQL
jgi:chromosome segregation ATPase